MLQTVQNFLEESSVEEACLIEPGILPFNGKMILYGPTQVGKSLLVSQLGFDVATGRPWLGKMPVTQGKVAYVQCEIGRGKFRDRVRKQMSRYEVPPESFFVVTTATMTMTKGDAEFLEVYQELESIRPSMLILDPQYKVFVGDENSNTEVKVFYNILDNICRSLDCAIVLVSHSRKARFEEGVTVSRGVEELKGAARQQEWADTVIKLVGGKNEKVLKFEKIRNGEPLEDLPLLFDEETLLFSGKPQAKKSVEAEILAMLEKGEMPRPSLMEFLKQTHSESTVKRALAELEEMGAVRVKPMPGNATMKVVERK